MREHLHHDAATVREAFGEQLHFAGGNDAMGLLRGWGAPNGSPTPAPQLGSSVPNGGPARGAAVCNTSGGQVSLGRVQLTTAALFAIAIGALILLNRAGFKFSVTVG